MRPSSITEAKGSINHHPVVHLHRQQIWGSFPVLLPSLHPREPDQAVHLNTESILYTLTPHLIVFHVLFSVVNEGEMSTTPPPC